MFENKISKLSWEMSLLSISWVSSYWTVLWSSVPVVTLLCQSTSQLVATPCPRFNVMASWLESWWYKHGNMSQISRTRKDGRTDSTHSCSFAVTWIGSKHKRFSRTTAMPRTHTGRGFHAIYVGHFLSLSSMGLARCQWPVCSSPPVEFNFFIVMGTL